MKTKFTPLPLVFATVVGLCLTNCTADKKEKANATLNEVTHTEESEATVQVDPQFQVDNSFKEQLAAMFKTYIELKDAFVASDVTQVKTRAANVRQALKGIDMTLLSGAAHSDWMNFHSSINLSLKEIESSTDIETQRNAFSDLSETLYKTMHAFGYDGNTIYYQYCPMAFNNEGAYWLSDQEQIRNPYFGDKMLTCGSVKEKFGK